MVDHQPWQLNGNAPELFQRYLVPAITAKWAEDIVDRARPQEGKRFWTSPVEQKLLPVWQVDGFPGGTSLAWTLT